MNISIDLLQTFALYVESASVVKTAERLGISQPAVSGHLKRLEELLPLPPLVNRGRRKTLTAYGQSLYDALQSGLKEIDRGIERTNQQFISPDRLSIRIGVRREMLARFAQMFEFPGQMIFSSLSSRDAIRDLLNHSIDVAITTAAPDSPDIVAKKLFAEGVKLIVHKRWALNRKRLSEFRETLFALEAT